MEFSSTTVRLVGRPIGAIIPREHIRNIRVVHDTSTSYPFARFFVGFMLLLLGGLGLLILFLASAGGASPIRLEGREIHFQLAPATVWLGVTLGVWSLLGVFRAGYHLTIQTDKRERRTFLGNSRDLEDIRRLVRGATWTFGYEIDASALGEVHEPADRAVGSG